MTDEITKYKENLINDIKEYIYSDDELEEMKICFGRDNTYIHMKAQNEAYKVVIRCIEGKINND